MTSDDILAQIEAYLGKPAEATDTGARVARICAEIHRLRDQRCVGHRWRDYDNGWYCELCGRPRGRHNA